MQLDQATTKDIDRLNTLLIEHIDSDITKLGPKVTNRFLNQVLNKDLGTIFLVRDENHIAGFILIAENAKDLFKSALLGKGKDILFLLFNSNVKGALQTFFKRLYASTEYFDTPESVYLAVDEKYRGIGIVDVLLEASEEHFKKHHIQYYDTEISKTNDMLYKYFSLKGFKELKNDKIDPNKIRMRKELDAES